MTLLSIHSAIHTERHLSAARRIAGGLTFVAREANPERSHGVTFRHLGKLGPISRCHLQDLMDCFDVLLTFDDTLEPVSPVVLGLAESGIIPSFAMHTVCGCRGISSTWDCSSRIDSGGPRFREPHSHAPAHFLPRNFVSKPLDEVWIVEDEITTGCTLTNLLTELHRCGDVGRVRVFAMLDARTDENVVDFENACNQQKWRVETTSLFRIKKQHGCHEMHSSWISPNGDDSPASCFVIGESLIESLPSLLDGTLTSLHHVTLSPWLVDGVHVLSRQLWAEGYYAYNVTGNRSTVIQNFAADKQRV